MPELPMLRVAMWTCPNILLTAQPTMPIALVALRRGSEVLLGAIAGRYISLGCRKSQWTRWRIVHPIDANIMRRDTRKIDRERNTEIGSIKPNNHDWHCSLIEACLSQPRVRRHYAALAKFAAAHDIVIDHWNRSDGLAQPNIQGVATVNPIFTWVRQGPTHTGSHPYRSGPTDVVLAAGMTATVEIDDRGRATTRPSGHLNGLPALRTN